MNRIGTTLGLGLLGIALIAGCGDDDEDGNTLNGLDSTPAVT